jgi:hypothetical protein
MINGENINDFKYCSFQRQELISGISENSGSGLSKFSKLSITNILKRFFYEKHFYSFQTRILNF